MQYIQYSTYFTVQCTVHVQYTALQYSTLQYNQCIVLYCTSLNQGPWYSVLYSRSELRQQFTVDCKCSKYTNVFLSKRLKDNLEDHKNVGVNSRIKNENVIYSTVC